MVHFKYWVTWKFEMPQLHYELWNDLDLQQLQDVKLNVVNTVAKNNAYVLTYVNSPDFQKLHYQSRTNLKYSRKMPYFWLGAGAATLAITALKFLIH